jgi:hypothetical protein
MLRCMRCAVRSSAMVALFERLAYADHERTEDGHRGTLMANSQYGAHFHFIGGDVGWCSCEDSQDIPL